jgi:hypothetical protein
MWRITLKLFEKLVNWKAISFLSIAIMGKMIFMTFIEAIRELIDSMQKTSHSADRKRNCHFRCQKLNKNVAEVLQKALEEPPEDNVLWLTRRGPQQANSLHRDDFRPNVHSD